MLDAICGEGTPADYFEPRNPDAGGPYMRFCRWESALLPVRAVHNDGRGDQLTTITQQIAQTKAHRPVIAREVVDALFDQYSPDAYGTPSAHNIEWSPLDEKQYLFIALNSDDFHRIKAKAKLQIQAVVHEKDNPNNTIGALSPLNIDPNEFEVRADHPDFDLAIPNEQTRYVWTAVKMTESAGYSPESAREVRDLVQRLKEWRNLPAAGQK
jgi:hypothetical protein